MTGLHSLTPSDPFCRFYCGSDSSLSPELVTNESSSVLSSSQNRFASNKRGITEDTSYFQLSKPPSEPSIRHHYTRHETYLFVSQIPPGQGKKTRTDFFRDLTIFFIYFGCVNKAQLLFLLQAARTVWSDETVSCPPTSIVWNVIETGPATHSIKRPRIHNHK